MKRILLLLIFIFSLTLSAQENVNIAQDEVRKISRHIQMNYRVPFEAHKDSINRINYNIKFIINEEGRVVDPEIVSKNVECGSCERELFRVLKSTPAITPAILNNEKVKVIYQLPFNIMLQ